ncbi:amidohydrolase [Belnapia sp. T6]|uniref:Amidohydrolase n=1 Tax=Belnapia mucosa TaxID=2804532 RepID=A0ABS1V5T6_9PROT|nr:amidohydrolase family protein [Belnapia mucosa]MBL6456652.1 amidohydrolase [Belnapia mucosa]
MAPHRIDIQHHILPPDYVRIAGAERIGPLMVSGRVPEWSPELSLEAMERNGIATAVVSISAPGVWFGDAGQARELARACNEYAAGLRRRFPGRFGFFAILPLPDVAGSLDEIAHSLDVLGADGLCLMTNYDGRYPGEAEFAPVFAEVDRRGALAFFHPCVGPGPLVPPGIPAATLEFPFDTTRAVASLLFSGVLARHRRMRCVFSHAGGTVPFLAQRMARLERRPEFRAQVPEGAMAELRRLYVDVALSANPLAFGPLLQVIPPEQILFASDYPFAPEDTMTATVKGLGTLGLAPEVLQAIEYGNAQRLMPGLTTPA